MIPVSEPDIGEAEIANVLECMKTGWISSAGSFIEEFEERWAARCGARHGVAVSNGSVALDIAVQALGIGPGDEVIMPTFTIISCAAAIVRAGAVPVLVDSDERTWGMDVRQIEARITAKTRAIMVVHIYGHPVDMDAVRGIADRHHLAVIEDAAEVHGAEYLSGRAGPAPRWRTCGGMGDVATFSFYANKLVTTGEGGMVVTSDDAIAARARSLRNLCFVPGRRFYHEELGFNARLTNLQAAIGVAQIARLPEIIQRKRGIAAQYGAALGGVPGLILPVEEPWARNVYWVYGIVLDETVPCDAREFAGKLAALGVETRPFFLGMHEQPALQARGLFGDPAGQFPVAARLARRGFYIPSGLTLSPAQVGQVASAVKQVAANA